MVFYIYLIYRRSCSHSTRPQSNSMVFQCWQDRHKKGEEARVLSGSAAACLQPIPD